MTEENNLYILWTNGSALTFKKMVSMCAFNSIKNNWWDKIIIIIWGETSKLVSKYYEVQKHIKN